MIKYKQLIVIGGTGRNVGKTEFVCKLIEKISSQRAVYGLKVSAIFPDEELFHGTHSADEPELHLFEETRFTTAKDTSRMLRAGAKKVFYLRSDDTKIYAGFVEFMKSVPEKGVVVCESNSLGQFVRPALSVVVKSVNGPIKPRAVAQLESADLVVVSDGSSGFPELTLISYSEKEGWELHLKTEQNFDL
jgi:hypothetical protein